MTDDPAPVVEQPPVMPEPAVEKPPVVPQQAVAPGPGTPALNPPPVRPTELPRRIEVPKPGVPELLQKIVNGHAFELHVLKWEENWSGDLGITTREGLLNHVKAVVDDPQTQSRFFRNGKKVYWNERSDTLLIIDPGHHDGGTVYRPKDGGRIFDAVKRAPEPRQGQRF